MLTGGNSAKLLYNHWGAIPPWGHRKIRYYFGDERCVPPEQQESNYGMVKQNLFPNGTPDDYTIIRMEGELLDTEEAARSYEQNSSGINRCFTTVSWARWAYNVSVSWE